MGRTIRRPVRLSGIGAGCRRPVQAVLRPAAPGSGITFNGQRATVANARVSGHATGVGRGAQRVRMVEHLLAACFGTGITDLDVRVEGGELPLGDGSARGYVRALRRAGVVSRGPAARPVLVERPFAVGGGRRFIAVAPARALRIACLVDLPGTGVAQFAAVAPARAFERDLAPARTFGASGESPAGLERRLGLGFRLRKQGTMVYPARARMESEECRHKILDLLGDLWLLGRPLEAAVYAFRPGHALNLELVERLEAS